MDTTQVERWQQLADRLEIQDLLTRYATALDTRDWDLFTRCFTPDATIDYTAVGGIKGSLPVVRAWLAEVFARFAMTQHMVSNFDVRIDGDTAECRSCLFNPMGITDEDGNLVVFFEGGYYHDRLVRTAEGWRIRERVEQPTFSTRHHPVIIRPFE
ncbi:MAG: nuclear transport factor 2 family protein [Candidatus Binatia bacterium]|nr:nuclear transport factor 2 family protein [Candidatus Binatia bacterium]